MPLDAGGTLSPAAFTTGPMMSGAAKVKLNWPRALVCVKLLIVTNLAVTGLK